MAEVEVRWTKKFTCPRRREDGTHTADSPFHFAGEFLDEWKVREDAENPGLMNTGMPTCSYCGSLNPDFFLEKAEEGWEVGPTDKNYKAYFQNPDGPGRGKFYYQHLDGDQRRRFIALYNDKKMVISYPGSFYVMPYFCIPAPGKA